MLAIRDQFTPSQQQELDDRYYFNEDTAQLAVDTWNKLIWLTKDAYAGMPFKLEPWQEEIVRAIFGWRERGTNKRRFKTLYLEVPRKNGKTQFVGGIAILLMILEGVVDAEIYCIATSKAQAEVVFNRVKAMIKTSPELARNFDSFAPSIYFPATRSVIKPLSAKPTGKHGLHTTYLLCDEIHEWSDNELYRFVQDGMAATYDPMELKTTTAGKLPGVGWDEHNYALKVIKGAVFNPRYLAVIFAANDNDDPADPKTWEKANPNYGISVDPDQLAEKWTRALENERDRRNFLRYHLNIWKEGGGDWIPLDRWDQCITVDDEFDWRDGMPERLKGRECYGGLDLASTQDIAAFVLYFPPIEGETKGSVLCWFFVPEENMEHRERKDRVTYTNWTAQKAIEATPGGSIDFETIRNRIIEANDIFNIHSVGFDEWNAEETRQYLQKHGIDMIKFPQRPSTFAGPTREFERRVFGKLLDHGKHPILRWMASNVVPWEDANGNKRPMKNLSSEKIDGIVALIMAIGLAMQEHKEEPESYLAQEGAELVIL